VTATEPAHGALDAPAGTAPAATPARSFGEEGGRLTYGSYLRVPKLLSQQVLASDPPAHDELLFITVHQVYELWFKQLLHELESVRQAMFDGQLWWAQHLLARVHHVERVLIEQVGVLETMTPQDFLLFREKLAPASGFQSVQFRELEFISGAKDARFLDRFRDLSAEEDQRLRRRLSEPSLWDAFLAVLAARDLDVDGDEAVRGSLLAVARDRAVYGDVWTLAEALLSHDENAALWRARHVLMVERQIGTKSGTGGSTGAPYLHGRLPVRYYPQPWELRSWL